MRAVQLPVHEQRKWITVVACGSAAGQVQPTFLFKRNIDAEVLSICGSFEEKGYLVAATQEGWATKDSWRVFLPALHTKPRHPAAAAE